MIIRTYCDECGRTWPTPEAAKPCAEGGCVIVDEDDDEYPDEDDEQAPLGATR